ncbi:MAG TPA: carboxypeptidase-like regulatory domain-containing protein [Ferruginibacter sp.]|nr:carboxypeptidase-like regulatory domain-containing protein [Ferruginibacter sp.]
MKQDKLYTCFIILFLVCSLPMAVNSQSFIKGHVADEQSKQPLDAATVTIAGSNAKAVTDEHGNFIIKTDRENILLDVSHIGYKTSSNINAKANNVIYLQADAVNLNDIKLSSFNSTKFNTISKIDLALKPVNNTQELMQTMPGLFIAQHAGGGKAEQIFLRGFDVDHGTDVQVSVDGMPVNMVSHAHGQGYADAHFIIPETINNIDFGAGPYYTQQGNLNTAGYVSFATFKNIPRSYVQVEAGRFNSFRTLAMIDLIKKNKEKQSAYLAGEFNYTDGPTESKQKFKRYNVFSKYNLKVSDATCFTASASGFSSNWYASGQIPDRAVKQGLISRWGSIDPTEGGNTERYNVNLQSQTRVSNNVSWENQVYYSRYIFKLYSNFTFFLNDGVNGDGILQEEQRNILGLQSKLKHQHYFKNALLQSTEGIGLRYDATQNSQLANQVKRQFLNNIMLGDIKEANLFAFSQHQLTMGKWLLDAGLRLDYFNFNYLDKLNTVQQPSQQKAIVSPKLNIQYTVNKALQLYVKTGKGFHSNDTRVVVANTGREILPAAWGADIGIIAKPSTNLFFNVAAWYLHLDQEFVYVGDAGVVEPSGKTRRQGIDMVARYQLTKKFFITTNVNFTKPRAIGEPKGANYIPLAPTLTSTGGIFYKAVKGFNGSITYRYIKNRPGNEDNSIVAKGYFLMNASINYTKSKYELGIALENIFNVDWNEAQFATESKLKNEAAPVTELHYTPGNPFFIKAKFAIYF